MSASREALRQQMLLRALWRDARPGVLAGWSRDGERFARGLAAYQANAGALAERALAAVFPTIQELLGEESFASLARALWHQHAPERGDLAQWGGALPAFLAGSADLADEPYLSDVARLEWMVHGADRAADESAQPQGLERLADTDPSALWLRLRAGMALLRSAHPVLSIWQAHRMRSADDSARFDEVRQAFAHGLAQDALVWRSGWKVEVAACGPAQTVFMQALLAGASLSDALSAAQSAQEFDFEDWLMRALQLGWIVGVDTQPPALPGGRSGDA